LGDGNAGIIGSPLSSDDVDVDASLVLVTSSPVVSDPVDDADPPLIVADALPLSPEPLDASGPDVASPVLPPASSPQATHPIAIESQIRCTPQHNPRRRRASSVDTVSVK
jgi:hypothetical protein